jgi:integrase
MRTRKKRVTWSVDRIRHPEYPQFTVRIGEFQEGGILFAFRQVNGKQTCRSLKCRRSDLGSTPKAQEEAARQLGLQYIKSLANASAEADLSDGTEASPYRLSTRTLTIAALADKYEIDGLKRVTPSYRRDTLATIRRVGKFLDPNLLVRDIKPSHIEKWIASRGAHIVAARGTIVCLSIAVSWAVGEGLLEENPLAAKRARDAMKIDHKPRRPRVTNEEFEKLKAVASQLPPAFSVLLDLAEGTGRRISAILGLRWADVLFSPEAAWGRCKELEPSSDWLVNDFKNGGIRWYAGLSRNNKRDDYVSPMPLKVKMALEQWQNQTFSIGGRFVFVAPNDPGRPLGRHVAKKWLVRAEELAKLAHQKQGGWHAFRRKWTTDRKHFPLKDLADAGGWRDVETPLKNYQQSDRETRLAVING